MDDFGPWLITSQDSLNQLPHSRTICVSFNDPPKPMKLVQIQVKQRKFPKQRLTASGNQSMMIRSKQQTPRKRFVPDYKGPMYRKSWRPRDQHMTLSPDIVVHRPSPITMNKALIAHRRVMSRSVAHLSKPRTTLTSANGLQKIISQSIHDLSLQLGKKKEAKPTIARFRTIKSKPANFRIVGVKQV